MVHNVLIGLHTAAASISFLAGALVLRPPIDSSRGLLPFRVYLASLIAAIAFVIVVIGIDWRFLASIPRAVFSGLAILGLYMVWRGLCAANVRQRQPPGWQRAYVSHVGFTLISLLDGFVIVLAIDLGAPGWLVAAIAVLGVAAGITTVSRFQAGFPVQN